MLYMKSMYNEDGSVSAENVLIYTNAAVFQPRFVHYGA